MLRLVLGGWSVCSSKKWAVADFPLILHSKWALCKVNAAQLVFASININHNMARVMSRALGLVILFLYSQYFQGNVVDWLLLVQVAYQLE